MWLTAVVWVHILKKLSFISKQNSCSKGTSIPLFLWTPSCKGFVGEQNLCRKKMKI